MPNTPSSWCSPPFPRAPRFTARFRKTLKELGVTQVIEESGRYDSVRKRLKAMDRATQAERCRSSGAAPDYIVGSVHAITDDGTILVGSGTGSQLGAYAYAAGTVILVVGHQKLVRDLTEARRRLVEYCLPREFARMKTVGYPGSILGKTLTLEREYGDRIRVILVPTSLGF